MEVMEPRVLPTEQRIPRILSREEAKDLRKLVRSQKQSDRVEALRELKALFEDEIWEQIEAHLEGLA